MISFSSIDTLTIPNNKQAEKIANPHRMQLFDLDMGGNIIIIFTILMLYFTSFLLVFYCPNMYERYDNGLKNFQNGNKFCHEVQRVKIVISGLDFLKKELWLSATFVFNGNDSDSYYSRPIEINASTWGIKDARRKILIGKQIINR